jgi:hypothetical protein
MPKESTNHDDSAGISTAMVYKESIDTQVGIGLKGNANKTSTLAALPINDFSHRRISRQVKIC